MPGDPAGHIQPRFEFRTFATDLSAVRQRMEALDPASAGNRRESSEIYILSAHHRDVNCKIRDMKMDIKQLLMEKDGLEQWTVMMKSDFPVDRDVLMDRIFPALGVEIHPLTSPEINLNQFIDILSQLNDIHLVKVYKKRYSFSVQHTICEFAMVSADGNDYHTFAVESESAGEVTETLKLLEAEGYHNMNYPTALWKVVRGEL